MKKLSKKELAAAKAPRGTACPYCWERWLDKAHDPKGCKRKWQAKEDGIVTVCFCTCTRRDAVSSS